MVVEEDMNPMTEGEEESRFDILGTIHSHPQDTIEPSELDWETMKTDGELVMGICSIRKTAKRRFVSFAFFGRNRQQLQLTIGEEDTSALSAKAERTRTRLENRSWRNSITRAAGRFRGG